MANEANETIITKKLTTTDDELFCQYQGQTNPQPARLCLDTESGELSACYDSNIGSSTTHRVFRGLVLEWTIPPLKVAAVADLMDRVEPLAQRIVDGATSEWDGSNYVGRLNEAAQDAALDVLALLGDMSRIWDEADVYEVWDAANWFSCVTSDKIVEYLDLRADMTDDEVYAAAADEVESAEVNLDVDDVAAYLRDVRDEME